MFDTLSLEKHEIIIEQLNRMEIFLKVNYLLKQNDFISIN